MKLALENVRGFAGKHEIDIKPLTILVGENSSGKTTLLSTLFVALQRDFPTADAFNRTPFEMGSYDTIATYRGGKYGRAPSFAIGWESGGKDTYSVHASFVSYLGTPRISRIRVEKSDFKFEANIDGDDWTIRDGTPEPITLKLPTTESINPSFSNLARAFFMRLDALQSSGDQKIFRERAQLFFELITQVENRPKVLALAPLRTRPHRTYDELIEDFKPEGDHVPLVLARALSGEGKKYKNLNASIDEFGKSSGLFHSLKVKRMGRQASDPFQLRVKSTGPDANLMDVGYGVSQALPVVVDSLRAAEGSIVLIQQPEVHLHPRAQAALGTFFSGLAKDSKKRFVIETHSDYLLDRVRTAVASGVIENDHVRIVFLERIGLDVIIHQIELDDLGNVKDAPPAYRSFFLQEQMQLMLRGRHASDH